MVRTFARRLADAGERSGLAGRAALIAREFAGLPFRAAREHLHASRDSHDHDDLPAPGRSGKEPLSMLITELRQGARRLSRAPGFTLASVVTLALGVGATTAVFSLVHSTVIDSLPFPESSEIVWLDHAGPGIGAANGLGMTDGLYTHYSAGARQLEDMAIWLYRDLTLGSDEPERLSAAVVTPTFFAALRTPPASGRPFTEAEVREGAAGVVISHEFAGRSFGAPEDAVGQVIRLDGNPVEIFGVMPAGFEFPRDDLDLWVPLRVSESDFGGFARSGVARLAPGATGESAAAELDGLLGSLDERYGESVLRMLEESQLTPLLPTLKEEIVRDSERTLWILLGSVAFVLLLTCANVANLLLVRAESRYRETALRRALGAGRAELIRYFMAEGILLSLIGGALGVGLAAIAVQVLVGYGPADLPRLSEVSIGLPVVLVALLISFLTSVVFGLLPALRRTPSLATTIKSGDARSGTTGETGRSRNVLVATQVALALVLLVATGLMSRSFVNLVTLDAGFDRESVLTFRVGLPTSSYPDRQSAVGFHREAVDRIAELPGVEAVGVTNCLPLCGSWAGIQLEVEGRPDDPNEVAGVVAMRRVNHSYLATLGIGLVRGRLPTRVEAESSTPVAVISERLVETYWPGEDPLGQRFRPGSSGPFFEIVGIVENTPIRGLSDDPVPMAYLPLTPGQPVFESSSFELAYAIRTSVAPQSLLIPAREVIRSLDANVPISNVSTLEQRVAQSNVSTAFTMVVLAVAAGIALLLGIVGIYGVISYSVGQRAKEIGIRMALGARAGQVSRAVLAEGGRVTLFGLVVGLIGAFALTGLMRSLLFGVGPRDPLTFAAMPVLLLAVALVATYLPARRAARVDPARTLRAD
ncbi:MAG: ABC transporter permease [Gemmatimonadota bacterium]|nr:ABC transporter permease [Gemmatimonadota bacterium]